MLIQSWLFFGLLTEYLEKTLDIGEFSVTKILDGEPVQCVCLEKVAQTRFTRRYIAHLRNSFKSKISLVRGQLDIMERLPSARSSPVPRIALFTRILVDTLAELAEKGDFLRPAIKTSKELAPCNSVPTLQIILDQFQANG